MSGLGNESTKIKNVGVQDYNMKDLANIYGVSYYRMRKKLKPHILQIGEPNGQFYEANQVILIFKLLILPWNVRVK